MNLTELEEQSLRRSNASRDEYPTEDVQLEEDEKLTLFEKLKHNKWQIRRKAYLEIGDLTATQKFPIEVDGDLITLESITPILQNMIYEQNLIALSEGLKAVKIFLQHYTLTRSHLAAFTTSLMEKLVLTKKNIQQVILDIFDKLIEMDDIGCIPNEVLKRLDTKNHKFIACVLNIVLKYFKLNTHIEDFSIRSTFKMMLPMISHSNKETRSTALEILKILYSYIEETYEDLLTFGFHEMRSFHLKELEILQKCPKSKNRKLLKLNDGSFRAEKKHQHSEAKVDLATLMPEKYLEIPYMVQNQQDGKHFTTQHQQNEKKKKLEEFNAKIETTLRNGQEIDSSKDYSFIINLMIVLLEDKNILINQEATKTITYLIRICKGLFPLAKLKHILTLIVEKINIKKKTTYNTSLYNVFDEVLICKCIYPDTFCDLLLTYAETSKNMNAKIASLHWFGTNFISFLTDRREILSNLFNENNEPKTEKISISTNAKQNKAAPSTSNLKPDEKILRLVASVYKRIQQILKKEQNHAIKKLSQEVLDILQQPEATYQGSHNIPTMPTHVTRESQNDISHHINDISSIKHSKVVNISNITIPQMDSIMGGERFETEDLQYTEVGDGNTFEKQSAHEVSKRSEFSLENLKPEEKEQLSKLMGLLNDIKAQDEHIIDKLEAFINLLEKTNMQVVQTCQVPILKKLKKILYTNSSDRKNIINFFDTLHTILIKINRICLELLPQTVKTQLKMLILFLSNIMNNKLIEKVLDSAYMTCSPDKFLSITLKIFEKVDKKYTQVLSPEKLSNSLRIYLNWLAVKIEKIQSVMMEETQLKFFENAYNQFRFTNLPQVHLGIVAILSKKHKQIDDEYSNNNTSRTFETPRIRKQKQASQGFDEDQDQPEAETGISEKLKNIESEIHSNLHAGLLKFSSLLSSIKKKNLERSSVTGQHNTQYSSPNRHWKRGVGREGGTPGKKSMKGPLLGHGDDKGKPLTALSIDELAPVIDSICSYISEQETVVFDDLMYKLKCICSPKDLMQIFKIICSKILVKECYGQRLSHEKVVQMMMNFCENLDKGLILSTYKEFFQGTLKSNYRTLIFNTAKVGLDLISSLYHPDEIPRKLISNLVEILVYALSEPDLKEHSEGILYRLLASGKREDLRKIFEVELLNSFKLYQVFLYWLETEQIQLDDPSPKKPQNQDILILDQDQDNDHEVLHDDSFSRTPDHSDLKPSNNKKAFRKSFEELDHNNPDDLKELALTLMHDEKVEDLETVKGTDEKIKPNGLYNLKQSANSEFGFSDLHNGESSKKAQQTENELLVKNGRKILAEKEHINFGDTLGRSNNHNSMMSNKENIDIRDKENMNFNKPSVSMRYGDDDSAEKWKAKFLNEKEKLHATIELLEKANHGYLNQVTEKTELVSKLENQRMINERLLDKFNNVSKENDKLKKHTQTLEQEKEKMAQSMVPMDKNFTKKFGANKKVMKENLAIMSRAADPEEQIKQMQELLLVSNNLEFEMGDILMKLYEDLEDYSEKLSFVINLKNSICIPQVLDNLSPQNQKFLLEMALKLCISENTQKEIILGPDGVTFVETQLTGELQLLLDALLRFHSVNSTLCNLIRILSEAMPADFNDELNKTQKMLLKLAVKCLVRLSSNFKNLAGEDVRVFDILLEIYKLFKLHPPESLKEEQPNIKDYETIFKNIRTLADNVIDLGPNKAKEFAIFFTKENSKSIFLDYVKSYTNKYYPNVSNMSF